MLTLHHLPKLRVSVTDWCNFKCVFCGGMEYSMENWRHNKQEPIDTDTFITFAKTYIDLGGREIHLTGGEPLYRRDIHQIISALIDLGAIIELNTNASLLTRERIATLTQLRLNLLKISLHAAQPDKFASVTKSLKFHRVKEAIRNASQSIPVRTNMVVQTSNLDQVIPVILLSQQLGAEKIHLLDLTYYADWIPELAANWSNEFIPLTLVVAPMLIDHFKGSFTDQLIFGCKFYEMLLPDGFKIVIKEAQPTLRHPHFCTNCTKYCHEGMFCVRLSNDGYANICPTENEIGFDIRASIQAGSLKEDLARIFQILSEAVQVDSWNHFLTINNLEPPKAFAETSTDWSKSTVRSMGSPKFMIMLDDRSE